MTSKIGQAIRQSICSKRSQPKAAPGIRPLFEPSSYRTKPVLLSLLELEIAKELLCEITGNGPVEVEEMLKQRLMETVGCIRVGKRPA
jgi:hypothetical protein